MQVVAANMVGTDDSLSGTHLLCAVGRYQEACSQASKLYLLWEEINGHILITRVTYEPIAVGEWQILLCKKFSMAVTFSTSMLIYSSTHVDSL